MYSRALPYFQALIHTMPPGTKLEQIIDRVQLRQPGDTPSPESWHRDTCNIQPSCSCADGDHMFGGWLNLDLQDQGFSCVLGTHQPGHNDGRGFATITDKAEKKLYSQRKSRVAIPPGHLIVFYANIVHEVLATKRKELSARMYCGWRLTRSSQPLFPAVETKPGEWKHDLHTTLTAQDLVPLPSGQTPPMHAKLHWVNYAETKLQPWSLANIKPQYLIERTMKSSGKTYTVVPQFLHQPPGVLYFPPYTERDIESHVPHVPHGRHASAVEERWQAELGGAGSVDAPVFLPSPPQQHTEQYVCDASTRTCRQFTGSGGSQTVLYPSLQACQAACGAPLQKRTRKVIVLSDSEDEGEVVVLPPPKRRA